MVINVGRKYLLSNGYTNKSWVTIIGQDINRTRWYGVSGSGFIYCFNLVGIEMDSNRFSERISLDPHTESQGDWYLVNAAAADSLAAEYGVSLSFLRQVSRGSRN